MIAKDALVVLAKLSAAFPSHNVPQEFAHLWVRHLAYVLDEDAEAAADEWIRYQDRMPSIAQFMTGIHAAARRRTMRRRPRELENASVGRTTPEEARARIAKMRQLLHQGK